MTQYFIEVHSPSGPSRRHRLPAGWCSIGNCDGVAVGLPSLGDGPPLRLRCERLAEGVALRAESPEGSLIRCRGAEHREVVVPWREDVFVGPLRLCFMRESGGSHPLASAVALAASVASLCGGWLYSTRWNGPQPAEPGHAPPALAASGAACPDKDPTLQVLRGDTAARMARAKMERFPFDAREGTLALDHLAQARECYTAAAEASKARELAGEYEAWRSYLQTRSQTMAFTLENAIAEKRYGDAQSIGAGLRELLHQHREHPFVAWLRQLDPWLGAQLAARAKGPRSIAVKSE